MGLLDQLNPSFLGLVAVFCICGLVIQRIISSRSLPSAPGPRTAALTNLWYVWKVAQGRFEQWNIRQHAQCGESLQPAHIYHLLLALYLEHMLTSVLQERLYG